VTFIGALSRERVRDLMREADLFVLGSRYETFGVVIAEAVASGTPVVTTATDGARFVLAGTAARVVPVGDVPALSAAIKGALEEQPSQADRLRDRATIKRRFGRAAFVDTVARLYAELGVGASADEG
jgi:glycosyltransferase involved in cell wall biosynthesis